MEASPICMVALFERLAIGTSFPSHNSALRLVFSVSKFNLLAYDFETTTSSQPLSTSILQDGFPVLTTLPVSTSGACFLDLFRFR